MTQGHISLSHLTLTVRWAILSERSIVLLREYVTFPCKEKYFEIYNYVQYQTGNCGFGGLHSRCLVVILGCLRKIGFQSSASPSCLNPSPLNVHQLSLCSQWEAVWVEKLPILCLEPRLVALEEPLIFRQKKLPTLVDIIDSG